jgi:hypothetical protein
MGRFFDILLRRSPEPTKPFKPLKPSAPAAKCPTTGSPFQAARVVAGPKSCLAAKAAHNHPVLARDAKALPLRDCTMSGECTCRYVKLSDRRGGDRRALSSDARWSWYSGVERRLRKRR